MKKHESLRRMILCAILCALVVAMTFVPYTGYISYGVIEITTLHIVVIIGSVVLGFKYGGILGLVWGITCLIRAYLMPIYLPFGFGNPLISVLPRVLVGIVPALVFSGLKKLRLNRTIGLVIATVCGSLTNTVLVLSGMSIFIKATVRETFQTIFSTLISLNGGIELVAAIIIVPAVYFALLPRDKVLGIDIGASTTKLALMRGKRCLQTLKKPDDMPLEEAIGKFELGGVKKIAITGVGATFIEGDFMGIPTVRVDEFYSLSRGAGIISKKHNFLAVSVGTGTSFVRVTPLRSWHVGGSGVGGGMLLGLANKLLNVDSIASLSALAEEGRLENVDLKLCDVSKDAISNLDLTTTVANFAKAGQASSADLARGLFNLTFESLGVMAAFAVQKHMTRTIVLIGTITESPLAKESLDAVARLHKVHFLVPEHSPFATAIGATQVIGE